MPFSSRVLMREASVYRGGGCVKCWLPFRSFTFSFMPSSRAGRSLPAFSSSSALSSYRAVKPSKATLKPEALNRYFPAVMVAWVVFKTQLAIWQAIKRSQISL